MEHRLNLAILSTGKGIVKRVGIHVIGDLQVGKIAKFVALCHVIDGDDVVNSSGVEPGNDVAANKACSAGHYDTCHAKSSS